MYRVRHSEEAVPPVYAREDLLAARFRVTKVLPYQQAAPFISNLSLAIFSGLLLVFAFPDWNLWSLGWVGTAPLIMAVVRERKFWRSLLLGTVTGTIFFAGSSHWVTYSMHNYGDIPLWLCYIILIVFSATLGVFTGLFAAVLGLAIKRFGGWAILAAPVIWAASEWLRLRSNRDGLESARLLAGIPAGGDPGRPIRRRLSGKRDYGSRKHGAGVRGCVSRASARDRRAHRSGV